MAFTELVTKQSGSDNKAWIPQQPIRNRWGNCEALLRAPHSSSGAVVSSLSLYASFDQLGSRCQNGYFYYDNNGWITAELTGRAGVKRSENETELQSMEEEDIPELPVDGKITWSIDEKVVRLEDKALRTAPRAPPALSKRAPAGTHIYSVVGGVAISSRIYRLYRDAAFTLDPIKPSQGVLQANLGMKATNFADDVAATTSRRVISVGSWLQVASGVPGASTVHVEAGAVTFSIEAPDNSWQALLNNMGTHVLAGATAAAVGDWRGGNTYMYRSCGIYYIYNPDDWKLIRIVVNGFRGSDSALP